MKTRKPLMVGEQMNARPVIEWTSEQRRLAAGWSTHEIRAREDRLVAPYEWVPAWTTLTADEMHEQLMAFYDSACRR